MIPFYSAESVRQADRVALDKTGMSSALLMENAGKEAAEALIRAFGKRSWVILCGPGNNGGDGFVLARHLLVAGLEVTVLLSQPKDRIGNEPGSFLQALENTACRVLETTSMNDDELARLLRDSDGIVDALLGTGSRGILRGECKRLLSLVPGKGPVMVSLDIPSGVDPSSGEVRSTAFRADLTLTFLAPKIGLRVMPGAAFAGKIEILQIGVPPAEILPSPEIWGYGLEDAISDWPGPRFEDHKGKKGTVLILGGSGRFRGAPLLAARAALRAGAGLVVLIVPECVAKAASTSLPETVVAPVSAGNEFLIEPETAIGVLGEWRDRADALVIGPGLGRFHSSASLVGWVSRSWQKPILLDADALHYLSGKVVSPFSLITPHEGEAAHLLGKTAETIAASRLGCTKELARCFGTVLLKGPFSLCCDGNRTGVVLESTPALAVPGSGDVLSGIAGTLLATGLRPWKAGLAGAWLHARAGLYLSRKLRSETGILSHELADSLPAVISELSPPAADISIHGAVPLPFPAQEPRCDS